MPVHRQGLLRVQGRVPDRPGGHAGPGPDGQRRRASRSARSRSVELEDGRAVIAHDDRGRRYRTRLQGRDDAAAAQDRPQGHGRRARPGHRRPPGELPEGGTIPVAQTLPDVNLDEILAALDARHARLPAAAGQRRRRGPARAAARTSATRSAASSRRRATLRADQRGARRAPRRTSSASIHNFSLLAEELGDKDDQLAEFVATPTRCSRVLADQEAALRETLRELPAALTATRTALGKTRRAGRRARPDARRRCARAPARSARRCATLRPFLRETTPVIRDELRPLVRAARPTVTRAAPGAARPRGRRRPTCRRRFTIAQPRWSTCSPTTRRASRGGLPVLALLGQPPRRRRLQHPGRARPDPPRPGGRRLPDRSRCSTTSRRSTRCSAR